jgi:hypothetical protein
MPHQARRPASSNARRTSKPDITAASGCTVAPNAQINPLRPPAIVTAE